MDKSFRRTSRLTELFFKNYPKVNMLKFFVDRKLNRVFCATIYKIAYWGLFKPLNRIQLHGKENTKNLQGPFLIVENHIGHMDAIMHLTVWAHLNKITFPYVWFGPYLPPIVYIPGMFAELNIKSASQGRGKQEIQIMVDRLKSGDIINIFPEGTYPGGVYRLSGLVQEGFTGAARIALEYEKQTGKKLTIMPVATKGTNIAYPPIRKGKRVFAAKIHVYFGKPFQLNFKSMEFDKDEIENHTSRIMREIADLIGQKRIIPNYQRRWRQSRK